MKLDCGLTDIDAEKIQDLLLFGIPQLKKLKLQSISLFFFFERLESILIHLRR